MILMYKMPAVLYYLLATYKWNSCFYCMETNLGLFIKNLAEEGSKAGFKNFNKMLYTLE